MNSLEQTFVFDLQRKIETLEIRQNKIIMEFNKVVEFLIEFKELNK